MAEVRTREDGALAEGLPNPPRKKRRPGRLLLVIGILLIAAAVGLGGYVWWTLWGTGYTTRAAQRDLRPELEQLIDTKTVEEAPQPAGDGGGPAEETGEPGPRVARVPGEAIAIIRIPKIEVDIVVVEGTGIEDLKKGPGHYDDTAYPWEESGRVGIAGHRTTYGSPFWSLDELAPGDRIVLATEYGIFEYRVTESRIIPPSDGSVLEQTDGPSLVLTTCHPRFSAAQRLIVFADRIDQA
ncbi:MAG TPA: sortase [Actinomycetota bacterium]